MASETEEAVIKRETAVSRLIDCVREILEMLKPAIKKAVDDEIRRP
jgi:hypothetical protein